MVYLVRFVDVHVCRSVCTSRDVFGFVGWFDGWFVGRLYE